MYSYICLLATVCRVSSFVKHKKKEIAKKKKINLIIKQNTQTNDKILIEQTKLLKVMTYFLCINI